MQRVIVPIVEGQSEVASVPILLRRIFNDLGAYHFDVARPFRVKRNRVVRPGELERAVTMALRSRSRAAGVLVLLDADDDCPAALGPRLLERCRQTTPHPVAVVLANREFEGWFLGAKESLQGFRGIHKDARAPDDPERLRGAKGRLSSNMEERRYISIDDQPAFVERFDFELVRARCPSFEKFLRDVKSLVAQLSPE